MTVVKVLSNINIVITQQNVDTKLACMVLLLAHMKGLYNAGNAG